jgi:hypothetical protein
MDSAFAQIPPQLQGRIPGAIRAEARGIPQKTIWAAGLSLESEGDRIDRRKSVKCEVQTTSAPQNCLPDIWGTRILHSSVERPLGCMINT